MNFHPAQKNTVSLTGTALIVTNKDGKETTYTLKKITLKNIQEVRLHQLKTPKTAFCLIKVNDKYAITPIPKDLCLVNNVGNHLCNTCARCRAMPEECGGCSKILEYDVKEFNDLPKKKAIARSKRIEKYDFILKGIETFGCATTDAFVVCDCKNYMPEKETKPRRRVISAPAKITPREPLDNPYYLYLKSTMPLEDK